MNELKLKDELNQIEARFVKLTDKATFDKEKSFALQHINKNKTLAKATLQSNLEAVLNIAQTGLSLNPVLKLAYLVPRFEGGVIKTCLEPSYQGLCKLVTDTGSAKQIYSHLVYEGDEFEVSLGTGVDIKHKPSFQTENITHVYMVAILSDGSKMIEVMTADQVLEIRERSESYKAYASGKLKSCVWVTDSGEMFRKTVIRRGIKYLPKTNLWDKIGMAVSLDESDYHISDSQRDYIESLLMSAAIPHEQSTDIYQELSSMSSERASEVIAILKDNQVNPVTHGNGGNQTDIKNLINNQTK